VSSDSYYAITGDPGAHPEATDTLWRWIVEVFAEVERESRAA
jgi:hypothetical protein